MSGVKKLHKESENSSKPFVLSGHLIGDMRKMFCLLLSATIQDGRKEIGSWVNPRVRQITHPVQRTEDAYQAAFPFGFGSVIWIGDRYFLGNFPDGFLIKGYVGRGNPFLRAYSSSICFW